MTKAIVCVACPVGCEVAAEVVGGEVTRVSGNRCPQGEVYARQEAVEPLRVLATSVKLVGGARPLVSVRTDRPVPLRLIPELTAHIRTLSVCAPAEVGQALSHDLLGTGADLVATRSMPRAAPR